MKIKGWGRLCPGHECWTVICDHPRNKMFNNRYKNKIKSYFLLPYQFWFISIHAVLPNLLPNYSCTTLLFIYPSAVYYIIFIFAQEDHKLYWCPNLLGPCYAELLSISRIPYTRYIITNDVPPLLLFVGD